MRHHTDSTTVRPVSGRRARRGSVLLATGAVLATGLVGAGGSAASAEEFSGNDSRRDLASGANLYAVDVTHDPFDITVTTKHRRIPNQLNGSISVFLDTDRSRRGPEYVMNGALGTDGYGATMLPTRKRHPWRTVKIDSLTDRRVVNEADFGTEGRWDSTKTTVPRRAIGNPESVRVAVRVRASRDDAGTVAGTDWFRQRFAFTPWLDASFR